MDINFTAKQENYSFTQLISGNFQNASEVVKDALRMHELYRNCIMEQLRSEIAKEWDGQVSKRSIKDIISYKKR